MAAGLVSHNITTASGVTFAVKSWVPDTTAPDVGAVPVMILYNSSGAEVTPFAKGTAGSPSSTDVLTVQSITGATPFPVGGSNAHDDVSTALPIQIGHYAVAHGANPTAVAAADAVRQIANRAGIPFVIGGHPNIITRDNTILASDGAQTNASLLTISTGSKIVVTQISAVCDAANSVNVAVRIGLGTATVPAAALAGTNKLLINGKFSAGGGQQKGNGAGIIATGADDEDLRITCDSPTGGALYVTYSYYTIDS
jgi:hypothetical protein